MRAMQKVLCIILIAGALSSCVLGGMYGYASGERKERIAYQEFVSHFQNMNSVRESKKLNKLDWCTELFRYNNEFVKRDPNCFMEREYAQGGNYKWNKKYRQSVRLYHVKNIELESQKKKPLDWCMYLQTENKKWFQKDTTCKQKA